MKLFGHVNLVDRIEVPSQRTITDAGQMIVPCAFARTGSMQYSAASLGLNDRPATEMVTVLRDEEEVFDAESMTSFRSAPVTIGHPRDEAGNPVNVTAGNAKELQVGNLEGLPVRDEDMLTGNLVIARQDAIDLVDAGTVELSAGYTCDLVMNDEGEIYQRRIRANHIAIVEKGRAGSACRLADEDEGDNKDLEGKVVQLTDDLEKSKESVTALTDERDEALKSVTALTDERDEALKSATKMEAERDAANLKAKKLEDELESAVESRVDTIVLAKGMTDLSDFSGKTINEIKLMVVADKMPEYNLEGKTPEYVEAMFDLIVDADNSETPMSKLLRKESEPVIIADAKDPVKEARQRMIDRNKK